MFHYNFCSTKRWKMKHVLKPIQAPYPEPIAKALAEYPKRKDGYIIQLFRVFANSERFLLKKGALNLLDNASPLSLRAREIVILRVTANKDCEYEWGVHVTAFSKQANLTERQIDATRLLEPEADCWSMKEQLLLKCVDDLCTYAKIQDRNYQRFQETWDLDQQLEILALCGNYHIVSFVANTTRLAVEKTGARFPAPGSNTTP